MKSIKEKCETLTAYINKVGFGADNLGFFAASSSVLFDWNVPRNPPLIIYAHRSQLKETKLKKARFYGE